MNSKIFVLLLLLLHNYLLLAQSQIDWKSYFTFEPKEGKNFILDSSAVVFNASVPGINIANDGKVILGWSAPSPNRKAGISFDSGKTFSQLFGIQQPMQPDGGFIYFPDGRTRFITEEPAPDRTPQRHKSRIISYISNDGYNWTRENGIRYQPNEADDSIASVCEVIQIKDSLWRMYYVGDWYRTNGIRTAISTDWGLTWNAESIYNILRKGDVDPHPVYLSNGKIRLYFRSGMNNPPSQSGISCCDSENGLDFDTTKVNFLIADSSFPQSLKLDPLVIKYPNGRIACYIGSAPFMGQIGIPKIIAAWCESTTDLKEKRESLSNVTELQQNYPNPFSERSPSGNPTTTITFTLAEDGLTTLKIYDILGREVQTLVNGVLEAGRIHQINFDGSRLSAGVYFYKLESKNQSSIKKFLLMK